MLKNSQPYMNAQQNLSMFVNLKQPVLVANEDRKRLSTIFMQLKHIDNLSRDVEALSQYENAVLTILSNPMFLTPYQAEKYKNSVSQIRYDIGMLSNLKNQLTLGLSKMNTEFPFDVNQNVTVKPTKNSPSDDKRDSCTNKNTILDLKDQTKEIVKKYDKTIDEIIKTGLEDLENSFNEEEKYTKEDITKICDKTTDAKFKANLDDLEKLVNDYFEEKLDLIVIPSSDDESDSTDKNCSWTDPPVLDDDVVTLPDKMPTLLDSRGFVSNNVLDKTAQSIVTENSLIVALQETERNNVVSSIDDVSFCDYVILDEEKKNCLEENTIRGCRKRAFSTSSLFSNFNVDQKLPKIEKVVSLSSEQVGEGNDRKKNLDCHQMIKRFKNETNDSVRHLIPPSTAQTRSNIPNSPDRKTDVRKSTFATPNSTLKKEPKEEKLSPQVPSVTNDNMKELHEDVPLSPKIATDVVSAAIITCGEHQIATEIVPSTLTSVKVESPVIVSYEQSSSSCKRSNKYNDKIFDSMMADDVADSIKKCRQNNVQPRKKYMAKRTPSNVVRKEEIVLMYNGHPSLEVERSHKKEIKAEKQNHSNVRCSEKEELVQNKVTNKKPMKGKSLEKKERKTENDTVSQRAKKTENEINRIASTEKSSNQIVEKYTKHEKSKCKPVLNESQRLNKADRILKEKVKAMMVKRKKQKLYKQTQDICTKKTKDSEKLKPNFCEKIGLCTMEFFKLGVVKTKVKSNKQSSSSTNSQAQDNRLCPESNVKDNQLGPKSNVTDNRLCPKSNVKDILKLESFSKKEDKIYDNRFVKKTKWIEDKTLPVPANKRSEKSSQTHSSEHIRKVVNHSSANKGNDSVYTQKQLEILKSKKELNSKTKQSLSRNKTTKDLLSPNTITVSKQQQHINMFKSKMRNENTRFIESTQSADEKFMPFPKKRKVSSNQRVKLVFT